MIYNVYYYQPNQNDPMDTDWKVKKPLELKNPNKGDLISAERQSGNIGTFIVQAVMENTIYVSEVGKIIISISKYNCEEN